MKLPVFVLGKMHTCTMCRSIPQASTSLCAAVLSGRGNELIDLAKGNLFREDGEQSVSSDKEKKEWRLVCKPQSM